MQTLPSTPPAKAHEALRSARDRLIAGSRPAGVRPPVIRPRTSCLPSRLAASTCALLLSAVAASATGHSIALSPSTLIVPSFRDLTNNDLGGTTFFGWTSGSFDGSPDNELLDFPAVTLGLGALDGGFSQASTDDIISSSNNIYTAGFTNNLLQLDVPTLGTIGSGFTTIIVQGRTAFGGYLANAYTFPDVGGDTPDVFVGVNSANQGQFWAKWEIAGNAATYDIDFIAQDFVSIARLTVDTKWDATSHAPDFAVVPEPSVALSILGGGALLGMLRRRSPRPVRHS